MSKQTLAIALCRVSSTEQLENNSLNRQREAVLKSAKELDAAILEDDWWSGSVSSKKGTNLRRKDLAEMITRCKKEKRIKYLIVDQPDRFMRSIDEAAYFEVSFRQLGVTVWYASDPDLNKGDLASKLIKFTKYLSAEGSNDDRIRQSIGGAVAAIKTGKYPFPPKLGYKRGYIRGVHELDEPIAQMLQNVLLRIANHRITPAQGLVELNNSPAMERRSHYKMDKFRKIITDPFYAGIVEMDKQVKGRNENGLHEPLIGKEQHYELVKIMCSKKKNQSGPLKEGNPKYPGNNIVECDSCVDKRNGKVVGFDHGNGKPSSKVWEKYRCRSCGSYLTRQDLHDGIEQIFKDNPITDEGRELLIKALETVWQRNETEVASEIKRVRYSIASLDEVIAHNVEEAIDPSNAAIKNEILALIDKKKNEIAQLEEKLEGLTNETITDKADFMKFAYGFVQEMGSEFLVIDKVNRLRCKQVMFPSGIHLSKN